MIWIDIGWPKQVLWPNGSESRRGYKTAAKKAAKHDAHWLTKAAIQRNGVPVDELFPTRPISVTIAVHASRAQSKPDRDNCVAVCKAYLDGMADAVRVDDREFDTPVVVFREPYDKRIVIELGA